MARQGGEFINNLAAYANRLVGYSINAEFARLQLAANNALARLRHANHEAAADLGPLGEAYLEARRELREFQMRHGLSRPARNPEHQWTTFGLLFVLIGLELVLNGFFFAKGSEFD